MIDGDTIRVSRRTIRLSGLDAPELDQVAKHEDGYWYKQGLRVKSELIRVIGGKHVQVQVEGTDKYGRVVGTVLYEDNDVLANGSCARGIAIAAYGEQYKTRPQREAQSGAATNMWRSCRGARSSGLAEQIGPFEIGQKRQRIFGNLRW